MDRQVSTEKNDAQKEAQVGTNDIFFPLPNDLCGQQYLATPAAVKCIYVCHPLSRTESASGGRGFSDDPTRIRGLRAGIAGRQRGLRGGEPQEEEHQGARIRA